MDTQGGFVMAEAAGGRVKGTSIFLDKVSVGATINIMMAAALAEGMTVIENAAKEPHVVDLANFLNSMGANIMGGFVGHAAVAELRAVHLHGVGVEVAHACAQVLEDAEEDGDIADLGDVLDAAGAGDHQCRGDDGDGYHFCVELSPARLPRVLYGISQIKPPNY